MKKTIKTLLITALFLIPFQANAAKMALSPGNGEFRIGCTNRVNIIVNTEGENTMAADAFLRYNPKEIEILDMNPAVGGIQIKPNGIYESYPGNITSNGRIKMTAFNRVGYFNGRGTLGSIVFKSKPGVEKTSISFEFSPGSSTDSNVANAEALDVLNAAYGGSYTFVPGSCGSDKTAPEIVKKYPDADAMQAPPNANIEFIITDSGSGVNLDTIRVDLNGVVYSKEGENQFTYKGGPNEYRIIVDPPEDFPGKKAVGVKIQAQDLAGNTMKDDVYTFNQFIPVEACQTEISPETVYTHEESNLKSAAPKQAENFSKSGRMILLTLLFFLMLSLGLNVWLFTEPAPARKKAVKGQKTVKKRK